MNRRLYIPVLCLSLCLGLMTVTCSKGESGRKGNPSGRLTASHEEAKTWSENILKNLTLEQKAGQMLFEVLDANYKPEDDPRFRDLVLLVRDHGLGGFVLSGGTPHDTPRLLNRLQELADIPLFISNAFESGPGQMIKGASEYPPNMAFTAIGDEKLAEKAGRIGAAEGRAMGIHITWSPTVDILTRPENPVQGGRSFGEDLDQLGRMAAAYIRGYQDNGMLATAKHFPGRGDVDLIPGTEFTVNNKSAKEVENEDFYAFKLAIDAGVTFIMSDHIAVPSVTDGSMLPGSVESRLATYWLREKLGFSGILISDDMWYKKVIDRFGEVESCVMAVKAGHDAILKPGDAVGTIKGIADAVRAGEIDEEQIDRSVGKILYWKARMNLHQNRFVDEGRIRSVVSIEDHRDFVHQIADLSLTLLKNDGVFPSNVSKVGKILHVCIQRNEIDPAPGQVSAKMRAAFPIEENVILRPDSTTDLYGKVLTAAKGVDTVIVSLFNPRIRYIDNGPLREKDVALIKNLIKEKPGAVLVMSYGNPYPVEILKDAAAFVLGYGEGGFYGNQIVYADSFIKLLRGEIVPKGKLPVTVSENIPLGHGLTY